VRIAVEIIKEIREVVGGDFPVTMKVSGDEYAEGGLSVKEMKQIVPFLEKAGIDAIAVSAGTVVLEEGKLDSENPHQFVRTLPMGTREGCFSYLARTIKEAVTIPIMAVGRINTPFVAEEILHKKQADLICLGRGLLADPYFPQKAGEGKPEEIRVCIACNQGCFDRLLMQQPITCMINPRIGRERECAIEKTKKPRTVWVVGGGPAGMEAARVASLRGNKVTLFNDQKELGGQLQLACIPPDREEFNRITHYQRDCLEKQKVFLKLNTYLEKEEILQGKPDTIIFATGAKPADSQIEGISGRNVRSAWDILSGAEVEGNNVIVIGGGLVGCEAAEFLAKKGKKIVLVEMLGEIAVEATGDTRKYLIGKLTGLPVDIRKKTTAKKITEGGILCSIDGKEEFIHGEAVVLALGAKPNRTLLQSLDIRNGCLKVGEKSIRILEAGDCVRVRTAVEAFSEGFEAGLKA
jgi:NADPH-dependent 2,4-dienoyl-CoA reductase/sulfur reductase-like enzyme